MAYDPILKCYKVVAIPPYECRHDPEQYVFGFDFGIAEIEAIELCNRVGREFVDIEFSSEMRLSEWGE
jgi:hypothetical protein